MDELGMRIVICEDNVLLALELDMILSDEGHVVSGRFVRSSDCLAWCRGDPPDLVLADIGLADGRTGLDLVEALADVGIPSIIISGEVDLLTEPTRARAVLPKPIRDRDLFGAIQQIGAS